ncbi:hypothetical protein NRIC_27120 [Enterococcus florum]|uniref:Uncharacterized protein n=1 Tax=Enterococcus florum TaxID=2480627 RepID=A0A4P5PEQ6_9ENTE|nr:hypothetical protein [Enterococcus florum]GCF94821.1 hypothetical protein NRIC_27120 [Enterococcus florum]
MAIFKEIGQGIGAVRGGLISGVTNFAAELIDNDALRQVGPEVLKRNKTVGKLVGQTLDGCIEAVVGTIDCQEDKVNDGIDQLAEAADQTKHSVLNTVEFATKQVNHAVKGLRNNDSDQVIDSAKQLAKETVISVLTFKKF